MKVMSVKRWFPILLLLALVPASANAAFDWHLYASMLHNYVHTGSRDGIAVNLVDYAGLHSDPMFSELVGDVQDYDPMLLTTKKQKEAFYINAYNILALKVVSDHWPVGSIKDIGNSLQDAWDEILLQNMNGQLSLRGIRDKVLVRLGDPRALLAIDCVSVSGPNLRRRPYEAATLDRQLDEQVRAFLSRTDKGLAMRDGVLHTSQLFDRYQDDFQLLGGVSHFIHRYRPKLETAHMLSDLPFDWHINSVHAPGNKSN